MLLLEDKIAKAVDAISYIPADFGTEEDSDCDDYFYDVVADVRSSGALGDKGDYWGNWFYGASKLVFDVNSSKVIKIPFVGMHSWVEDYDEEAEEYLGGENVFEEFTGAANEENHWDYCAVEVERYAVAEEDGFAKFFAKTELYGRVADFHPVYVQEKCICYDDGGYKSFPSSEASKKYSEKHYSWDAKDFKGMRCLPDDWVGRAIDLYGVEEVEAFLIYLREMRISDLHIGNIGYTFDGRPVLIDYSGFSS